MGPTYTELEGALADDIARRRLHVHLPDVAEWAPAPSREAYATILAEQGGDPADRHAVTTVLRVFSPDVPVALHADGEIAIDCGVGGRHVWPLFHPDVLREAQAPGAPPGGPVLRRGGGAAPRLRPAAGGGR